MPLQFGSDIAHKLVPIPPSINSHTLIIWFPHHSHLIPNFYHFVPILQSLVAHSPIIWFPHPYHLVPKPQSFDSHSRHLVPTAPSTGSYAPIICFPYPLHEEIAMVKDSLTYVFSHFSVNITNYSAQRKPRERLEISSYLRLHGKDRLEISSYVRLHGRETENIKLLEFLKI